MKHVQTAAALVVVLFTLLPKTVEAQSLPEQKVPDQADLAYAVKTLQAQLALIQLQLNAAIGDTRMRLYVDVAYGGLGSAVINGWAFKCGPTPTPGLGTPTYIIDLLVDGMPAHHKYIIRSDRPDAQAAFAPYCAPDGMPGETGFSILVDLQHVTVGLHEVNVRIKDRRGAVETSNTVLVTIQ